MCGVRCVWGKWSGSGDGTTATSITSIDKVQIARRERIIESKRWQNAHFKSNHTWKDIYIIIYLFFCFVFFFLYVFMFVCTIMTYIIALHMHPKHTYNWLFCTLYLCLSCYTIFICKYILGYVMKMDQWTPNCTWRRPADGGAQVSLLEIEVLAFCYLHLFNSF